MQKQHSEILYREDIDGLRAIAVLSVIIFHLGFLPNGYLGVDVFFVISGFLITKITYQEVIDNHFSIKTFYLRRIRRIIPLVLFINIVALIVGVLVMLPDDLENLAQSVVATNLFANNILQFTTARDYWNIVNEYRPLMHTWSLGIEEQFYFVYPLILLAFGHLKRKYILPTLVILFLISLTLFLLSKDVAPSFYLIQYRFFEMAFGGIGAILFGNKLLKNKYSFVVLFLLIAILVFAVPIPMKAKNIITIILALLILLSDNNGNSISKFLLQNRLMTWIGKISFSLYMWHQIVLAFARYFVVQEIELSNTPILFILIFVLSAMSYYLVEQPFRNKHCLTIKYC